jgi:hypothetical protein
MQSLYKNFHSFIQMNFIGQRIKKYCLISNIKTIFFLSLSFARIDER